ncbi:cold-inducible protein YdjO-related protein [Paenibacillus methanolicus]|uniref:Cold-inducible protein YdjO n=1 Tax=Paenibacillus methanolicus TaxID=582686 RepID=A0A5S5CM50_9BACL|nr:cold-inducible protein YdjO-related protein [Paenibacillus methanolicus]TYP79581.1 cold-inducible protein YdjO [Paenibacillus methanolicus]
MTEEQDKPKLVPTKIYKCKDAECKAWVREELAAAEPVCPICKGPMHRSIRHLPALQNKIKKQKPVKKDLF